MERLRKLGAVMWRPLLVLVGAAVIAVVAERVVFLRGLHAYFLSRPVTVRWLTILALNVAAAGVVLLAAAYLLVPASGDGPMGQAATQMVPVEQQRERHPRAPRRRSPATPEQGDALLPDGKGRTSRGQRMLLSYFGAACMAMGVLGFMFVVGPPAVKLGVMALVGGGMVWGAIKMEA